MRSALVWAALLLGCAAEPPPRPIPLEEIGWHAEGTRGAVGAGGKEAVAAGIEILQAGGNAADAAAATLLALSVTDHREFCFGSEVPILVFDGEVEVLSGMGAAPRLATREHFKKPGGIPARGLEPAAVPAALDAILVLLARKGTITFAQAVAPTLRLLDRHASGWQADLARTIRRLVAAERDATGDRARKLRAVSDFFYRGPIAREIDAWSRQAGGLIRYEDLAAHETRVEKPVTVEYRGYTVAKCGPWTQGPYVLEALRLLEGFDLRALGHNSPDALHLTLEAMKLGLADRDAHYGDPAFVEVPMDQLLSREYADLRRPLIDPKRASLVQRPGDPRGMKPLLGEEETRRGLGGPARDTTTCVVADRWGNVVAATPSGWSGVVAGPTGVWLGTRLQSFNTWAGHPNCIEPGKRPRITLTPTLVLKDGKAVLAISVAGGDGQDQVTLQLLLNHIDFGLPPDRSVTAPRMLTDHFVGSFRQKPPELGSMTLPAELERSAGEDLRARGHRISVKGGAFWHPVALSVDPATGRIRVAGDPKARRHAAAY